MLLIPLVYAEAQEFYCEADMIRLLTLKINTDPKNPLFLIENGSNLINKSYNHENIDIKKLRVTVFDDEDLRILLFNRVAGVLVTSRRADNKFGKNDYQRDKEDMRKNRLFGSNPFNYT